MCVGHHCFLWRHNQPPADALFDADYKNGALCQLVKESFVSAYATIANPCEGLSSEPWARVLADMI